MEIPYAGRAIINDSYNGVEITIPAKRNFFIIIFLSFWLCGWAMGEFFALTQLAGFRHSGSDLFLFVWVCLWTVGGAFAMATWWWNIAGKEIVTASPGVLTIDKKGAIFKKIKSYDLNEAKNFRAYEEPAMNGPFGTRSSGSFLNTAANGTIKFDYGMETVKFGDRLYQAEGDHIIEKLRNKKLIS